MGALLNRARMTTATTGTGTVTLGSAVTGFASFSEAGATNATAYSYCIEDGNDFEIGIGTYTSSGTTFSRDTVTLSKISGTAGTTRLTLSGSATIFITARAQEIATLDLAQTFTTTQTITPAANSSALVSTGYSLTGTNAQSLVSLSGTWNTTGTPTAIDLNITNTASNANSLLMNLRVDGTPQIFARRDGRFGASRIISSLTTDLSNNFAGMDTSGIWSRGVIGFSGTTIDFATSGDLFLQRDAANTLAQRNGTNAQTFRIYNIYLDASNYERGFAQWSSNVFQVGNQKAGTGSFRDFEIVCGNDGYWTGNILHVRQDNTTSAAGVLRMGGSATGIGYVRSQFVYVQNYAGSSGASIQMEEMTAPSAPATNSVRIYAEDNGSGKTRLMALFATGAAQQIAIEP